ncbi:hypothetical protein GGQ67_001843 [Rhizobium metallidurans]|uniref:Uncharacterized protein n=1 Tax=Rhizobium metallidurans TaxID=1265931 RepID=A0A7W6CTM2_9HYPH|nr:hypothetical protein [Rhizobium metallidurans]
MENRNDLDVPCVEPIGNDVGNIRQSQFPGAGYSAGTSHVGLITQEINGGGKSGDDALSGSGVILPDPFTDVP